MAACLAAVAVVGALLVIDRTGGRDGGEETTAVTLDEDGGEEDGGEEDSGEGSGEEADTAEGDDTADPDDGAPERRDAQGDAAAGGPNPQDASGVGEAELPNLDITPADFRDRWNEAVRAIGRGYPLDELMVDDPDLGGDAGGAMAEFPVEQPMGAFGRIEVRVRSDGLVSSAVVEGEPADQQQEDDYFATAAAAVAAVTGLSAPEAVDLLATDLGIDGTADADSHVAGTEVDDVVIQIEAASGLWNLYVGGPWTG